MNTANLNNNAQGSDEPIKIGFSTPDLNDRYLRYLEVSAREYAERNGIDFLLADAQNNVITQQEQIKKLIEQGSQILIVTPADTRAMAPVTKMAQDAGIPLIYLNRNPYVNEPLPQGVYYVGSKSIEAGILQGEYLGEHLKSGNVGILMGTPGLEQTEARTKGVEEVLAQKYPNLRVIVKGTANYLREPAYQLVKEWLSKYGKSLNAIVANNDEMALGAIKALKEAGRNDVMVLGIDGLQVGRQAVQEGTLAATVFQDADAQGETAVNLARQLVQGDIPSQQIFYVPHILITSGVISQYPIDF